MCMVLEVKKEKKRDLNICCNINSRKVLKLDSNGRRGNFFLLENKVYIYIYMINSEVVQF